MQSLSLRTAILNNSSLKIAVGVQSPLICARLVPNLVICLRVQVPAESDKSHGCESRLDPVLQIGRSKLVHAQTNAERHLKVPGSFVPLLICSAVRQIVDVQTAFHNSTVLCLCPTRTREVNMLT